MTGRWDHSLRTARGQSCRTHDRSKLAGQFGSCYISAVGHLFPAFACFPLYHDAELNLFRRRCSQRLLPCLASHSIARGATNMPYRRACSGTTRCGESNGWPSTNRGITADGTQIHPAFKPLPTNRARRHSSINFHSIASSYVKWSANRFATLATTSGPLSGKRDSRLVLNPEVLRMPASVYVYGPRAAATSQSQQIGKAEVLMSVDRRIDTDIVPDGSTELRAISERRNPEFWRNF